MNSRTSDTEKIMTIQVVVVDYYNLCEGSYHKVPFKVFENIQVFEDFCLKHKIQIMKGAFGSTYYDDEYCYVVNHVEYIS